MKRRVISPTWGPPLPYVTKPLDLHGTPAPYYFRDLKIRDGEGNKNVKKAVS